MVVATESDAIGLIGQYGPGVGALDGVPCYFNALKAAVIIFEASHGTVLPHVWSVDFPDAQDPVDRNHAYLECNGLVFNAGVTWVTDRFPNLSRAELQTQGRDVTVEVFAQALQDLAGDPESKTHFDVLLANFFPDERNFLAGTLGIAALVANGSSLQEALQVLEL